MKTIILEGTSTSGKTVLAQKLFKIFVRDNWSCKIIGENRTLLPILENSDTRISLDYLLKVVQKAYAGDEKIVIFDRLHLTSLAITDDAMSNFARLEKKIEAHYPLLVFLKIKESEIPARIFGSMQHRNSSWIEYVNKKGDETAIIEHYIETQRKMYKFFCQSDLPKLEYDTTEEDFTKIAEDIAKKVVKK